MIYIYIFKKRSKKTRELHQNRPQIITKNFSTVDLFTSQRNN